MKPLIVSLIAGCAPALISSAFGQDPPPPPAPPAHEEHAHPGEPEKESGPTKQEKQRQRAERIERAERDRQRQRLERGGRPADNPEERREAPDRRSEGPPPAELERKLHHVEQAIGHLREAGLPDPAQNLERLAQRLRQALHDQHRPGPQGPDGPPRQSGPSGPFRPSGPSGPPPDAARRDDELAALRREVEALKATVKDLCKMAKPAEKSESHEEPAPEKHH